MILMLLLSLLFMQEALIIEPVDSYITLDPGHVARSTLNQIAWELAPGSDRFFALLQSERKFCSIGIDGQVFNSWVVYKKSNLIGRPLQGMMVSEDGETVSICNPQNEIQLFFDKKGNLIRKAKIFKYPMPGSDFGNYVVRSILRSQPNLPFAAILSNDGILLKELYIQNDFTDAAKLSVFHRPMKVGQNIYFVSKKFSIMLVYNLQKEVLQEIPIKYEFAEKVKDYNIMEADIDGSISALRQIFGSPAVYNNTLLIPVWTNKNCLEMLHVGLNGSIINIYHFEGTDEIPVGPFYNLAAIKTSEAIYIAAGSVTPKKPTLIITFPKD